MTPASSRSVATPARPRPAAVRPLRFALPGLVVPSVQLARLLVPTLAGMLLLASSHRVAAQAATGRQLEVRAEYIGARTSSLQGGVGLNLPAGRYIRVGTVASGGLALRGGETSGAARADLFARFLLDPFAESPIGLYGIGGVSVLHDRFERTRPRVLLGLGVESRPRGGRIVAAEAALGGGVRLAIVLRRARRTGR